jgi:eukaryotic-like serine/threonine-protein kinase
MGEVYRARDPRLGRDVAVKIISGEGPPSPERLQRFEQEARAVAALQHPHILSVFDVGTHEGRAYLVFELLEGETLRERLSRGPLPTRKAIELAIQAAHGLAAAHVHGILHRDLKPENVFLGHEGVKLLDFGLAKLTEPQPGGEGTEATPLATDEGIWVGTPGYVSPEQLRGLPATPRSDVFALGAVLYEMLSGQRAFKGATKADTLSAILEHDPPPMTMPGRPVPLALDKLVRRCVEKDPDDRFQSARDVAFALDAVSSGSSSESAAAVVPARPSRRWLRAGAALLVTAAIAGLAFLGGRLASEKPAPTFKQLTFRRGWLDQARFAPDGRTVIYGAGWDGRPVELFQTRTDSPESRPLGLVHTKVLSISSQGQMAILLDPSRRQGYFQWGTLAVVPLAGGTPRELLEKVISAAWTPDGRDLCVSRVQSNGEITIELPPGTVLHRTSLYAGPIRVSGDGRYIAYGDSGVGKLMLIDRERRVARALAGLGANLWGLAWAPAGREVWFTEGSTPAARDVYAVDLEGRRRLVYRSAGVLGLVDTAPDGRVLLHRSLDRMGAMALLPGSPVERDVTVYDDSSIGALSSDGRLLLLNSTSEGAGPGSSVYLRRDGGDPVRLAAGEAVDLSPDGDAALVVTGGGELAAVPIGAGLTRKIDLGALRVQRGAWVPSPRGGMIVRGRERPDEPYSFWLIDESGSKPRRLDAGASRPRGVGPFLRSWAIAPDGQHVAVKTAIDTISLVSPAGGPVREVRIADTNLGVSRWSGDGRSLFLARAGGWPCEIHRLDLATEKVELWKQAAPPDPTGLMFCDGILPSADGRSYVYAANRVFASLIVAEGLK